MVLYNYRMEKREQIMTKAQAKKLGWKITGKANDVTAEKGRVILMCMTLPLALKMIERTEEQ